MKRLSKQSKVMLLVATTLVAMVATIPAAIWLTHTGSAETGHARLLCEQHNQASHTVYISPDHVIPAVISAKHCDILIVVNLSSHPALVAIFSGRRLLAYDGATSRTLGPQQQVTITLVDGGQYQLGDSQAIARGELNVSP